MVDNITINFRDLFNTMQIWHICITLYSKGPQIHSEELVCFSFEALLLIILEGEYNPESSCMGEGAVCWQGLIQACLLPIENTLMSWWEAAAETCEPTVNLTGFSVSSKSWAASRNPGVQSSWESILIRIWKEEMHWSILYYFKI